jgi:hypothetical protein
MGRIHSSSQTEKQHAENQHGSDKDLAKQRHDENTLEKRE